MFHDESPFDGIVLYRNDSDNNVAATIKRKTRCRFAVLISGQSMMRIMSFSFQSLGYYKNCQVDEFFSVEGFVSAGLDGSLVAVDLAVEFVRDLVLADRVLEVFA